MLIVLSFKRLKFAPKWSLSKFQPILVAIFDIKATVKLKLIPDFFTLLGYYSNKLRRRNW